MGESRTATTKKALGFWGWATASIIFRLVLIYFPTNLNLSSRPEVSTLVTSLRRLAEGHWLKQAYMSSYAGSMYHGSPVLLSILGPLVVNRVEGQPNHILCSLVFVIADLITSALIRATGQSLQVAYHRNLKSLGFGRTLENSEILSSGDFASLVYLWNPFTIITCLGSSTTPIENLVIVLSLYGACYGPDAPPRKLFLQSKDPKNSNNLPRDSCSKHGEPTNESPESTLFSLRWVILFFVWSSAWALYILVLYGISLKEYGGLGEMFKSCAPSWLLIWTVSAQALKHSTVRYRFVATGERKYRAMVKVTYGFIFTVEDLSPNIGVLCIQFFRNFFLIVFYINILFMILPLAIRLYHRPCFLAFVYIAISSVLKSYPSVGDSALYLGLLALFVNEVAEMQFSFFLFSGYVGVSLLSPVMHNLWIWRGTGNANFYFATAMAYTCFQIVLVVESVGAMLNHDRKI